VLLALAYPDRVGRRRAGGGGRFQLSNGCGAIFEGAESVARHSLSSRSTSMIVSAKRIRLAIPIDKQDRWKPSPRISSAVTNWRGTKAEAVVARRFVRLGELLIEENR
jgi:ATP-dependent helicase HrpB